MKDALRQIFNEARSDDPEVREEATLQIAMLLEKQSPLADTPSFYQAIQTAELANTVLDASEQQAGIDELHALILSTKPNSSMIWALGKVKSLTVLGYLIDLVCSHRQRLNDDAKRADLSSGRPISLGWRK